MYMVANKAKDRHGNPRYGWMWKYIKMMAESRYPFAVKDNSIDEIVTDDALVLKPNSAEALYEDIRASILNNTSRPRVKTTVTAGAINLAFTDRVFGVVIRHRDTFQNQDKASYQVTMRAAAGQEYSYTVYPSSNLFLNGSMHIALFARLAQGLLVPVTSQAPEVEIAAGDLRVGSIIEARGLSLSDL